MDPGTIINVVALLLQLLDLIRNAGTAKRRRNRDYAAELDLFHSQLQEKLQFANDIKEQAVSVGLHSKSLDILQNELQENFSSAKNLLSIDNCKKEDIQKLRELRERAHGTLQDHMPRIAIEMSIKSSEDVKAIKEMMAKKQDEQEMVSRTHDVHINIFQGQAHGYPMLMGPLSYVTETLWEWIHKVLADEHLNVVVPTEAPKDKADPHAGLFRVADAGMIKGAEESGWIKEGAGKDLLEEKKRNEALVKDMEKLSVTKDVRKEEEEKKHEKKKEAFLTKEGAEMDVLEEKEMTLLVKDTERPGQRTTELNDNEDNPNCNMQLNIQKDTGELLVSEYKGSQWKVTYKWCEKSMGMVTGNSPMEVSKKDGYCYYEVKLVDMAELHEGRETGLAGVGVGLARWDKLRPKAMAGQYSMSCGYDGRVGEVYFQRKTQQRHFGFLVLGDTVGIGLLQHHGQCCIFFTKNGDLQMCIQDHSLRKISSDGGVYPVISLASAHVQLHVNFHGPFQLSEVVARVKATLAHK